MSGKTLSEGEIQRLVKSLAAEIPSLAADSLEDAHRLHAEALMNYGDWEFLGVFQSLREGVEEAIGRGGQRFQANFTSFELDGLPKGYYIYFSVTS